MLSGQYVPECVLQHSSEGDAEGSNAQQAAPACAARGLLGTHLLPQAGRTLGNAGFATLDAQEGVHVCLGGGPIQICRKCTESVFEWLNSLWVTPVPARIS